MINRISIAILFILSLLSCSESDVYTPIEMFQKAYNFDNTIEEVRIGVKEEHRQLHCSDYPSGCIPGSPKRFKIRLVEMIVVQYHSTDQACLAALKTGQWHARNWLFDDVTGEPVLEDFVKQVYNAKNPKTTEDCD